VVRHVFRTIRGQPEYGIRISHISNLPTSLIDVLPRPYFYRMKFLVIIAFLIALSPSSTTYYLVRHAEKACDDCDICGLSAEGISRAVTLANYLSGKGIDTIFSSQCLRARNTAQPLADILNKSVTVYQTNQLTGFINTLKSFNGSRQILVIGHSNQIPAIIDSLAHRQVTIADDDYDNLYVVKQWTFLKKTVSLRAMTYGEESP
jgi:phosphohistidine phosphatase SixA